MSDQPKCERSAHERLRIIQDRLESSSVRDIKFFWGCLDEKPLSAVANEVADVLEAYLDGKTDPMPPLNDRPGSSQSRGRDNDRDYPQLNAVKAPEFYGCVELPVDFPARLRRGPIGDVTASDLLNEAADHIDAMMAVGTRLESKVERLTRELAHRDELEKFAAPLSCEKHGLVPNLKSFDNQCPDCVVNELKAQLARVRGVASGDVHDLAEAPQGSRGETHQGALAAELRSMMSTIESKGNSSHWFELLPDFRSAVEVLDRLSARCAPENEGGKWKCGADRSGIGGNMPQDCDWPYCGCDETATKVIEALQEQGWMPAPRSVNMPKRVRPENPRISPVQPNTDYIAALTNYCGLNPNVALRGLNASYELEMLLEHLANAQDDSLRLHHAYVDLKYPAAGPAPGLLMSMAIRMDHGLGVPGYYDQPMFASLGVTHAQRLEGSLKTCRQLWEEVMGRGFYRPEKEAEYAARRQAETPKGAS